MRILLDECLDWRLSRFIAGHEVKSVGQMGCTGIKLAELLPLVPKLLAALVSARLGVVTTVSE